MLRDCRKKKIDLILTKSVSRFGRNTLDILKALRELRDLEVDVYFEEENLWLHDREMDMLLTTYCAFAQHESESMSKNIRQGIQFEFQNGTSGYANFTCFGYKQGNHGELKIDRSEAASIKKIFAQRTRGKSLGQISDWLFTHGVPSPRKRKME